jgi:hypothetical protein
MLLVSRVKCFLSGSTSDCEAELGEAAQQRVHADGWIRNLKLPFFVALVFFVSWASLVPPVGDNVSRLHNNSLKRTPAAAKYTTL